LGLESTIEDGVKEMLGETNSSKEPYRFQSHHRRSKIMAYQLSE